jgi:hypothetical protein
MKRALVVGIDEYESDEFPTLSGCVRDAEAILPLLQEHEQNRETNFDCRSLGTSDGQPSVTRDEFTLALEQLFREEADMAVLFFAGHGMPKSDALNLVTSDGTPVSPGVSFSAILDMIKQSPVDEIIILLDCCFSGGAARIPAISNDLALVKNGLSILTASRAGQSAMETEGRGQFSVLLESGLLGGAADVLGEVSVAGLYSYVSESFGAWDQRPTFLANVEQLQAIRKCAPSVDPLILRDLPEWFPDPSQPHALDPSYEKTTPLPIEADAIELYQRNRTIFSRMQKCAAAKLIVPVDADHMYFAAMERKGCKLTHLGAHYWELAKKHQL